MSADTLRSKEAVAGEKAGEVGLDDEGVAAAEAEAEADMAGWRRAMTGNVGRQLVRGGGRLSDRRRQCYAGAARVVLLSIGKEEVAVREE